MKKIYVMCLLVTAMLMSFSVAALDSAQPDSFKNYVMYQVQLPIVTALVAAANSESLELNSHENAATFSGIEHPLSLDGAIASIVSTCNSVDKMIFGSQIASIDSGYTGEAKSTNSLFRVGWQS